MFLVIDHENRRLCKDNHWRSFANFGTYPQCVKIYKQPTAAKKKAQQINGKVVELPTTTENTQWEIDASGKILEIVPSTPGYVKTIHHRLDEFVIWPPADTH